MQAFPRYIEFSNCSILNWIFKHNNKKFNYHIINNVEKLTY